MRNLILILSFILVNHLHAQQKDIGQSLNSGNVEALSEFFNASIELALPELEGVYNKNQAQIVLSDFFSSIEIEKYEFKHKGGGNAKANFEIGRLHTNKGNYRCYTLFKVVEKKPQIIEFRIDKE